MHQLKMHEIFDSEEIDLHFTTLSPNDVECIAVFLAHSTHKEWKEFDLTSCYIQDHGVQILYTSWTNKL